MRDTARCFTFLQFAFDRPSAESLSVQDRPVILRLLRLLGLQLLLEAQIHLLHLLQRIHRLYRHNVGLSGFEGSVYKPCMDSLK